METARFSVLSGCFSNVSAVRRTEALKKHAEARWKTGKGDFFLPPAEAGGKEEPAQAG
jgi:hypothetical protein